MVSPRMSADFDLFARILKANLFAQTNDIQIQNSQFDAVVRAIIVSG